MGYSCSFGQNMFEEHARTQTAQWQDFRGICKLLLLRSNPGELLRVHQRALRSRVFGIGKRKSFEEGLFSERSMFQTFRSFFWECKAQRVLGLNEFNPDRIFKFWLETFNPGLKISFLAWITIRGFYLRGPPGIQRRARSKSQSTIDRSTFSTLTVAIKFIWSPGPLAESLECGRTRRIQQFARNRPNTVSGSTVSNTELSEFFGAHWAPGANSVSSSHPIICVPKRTHRVFFLFFWAHRVCPKTQWGSVSSLLWNSTLETEFRYHFLFCE